MLYMKIMDLEKKPCELSKTFLLKNHRVFSANKFYSSRVKEMKKIKNENKVIILRKKDVILF